ncbi:AraC family transcriptional regulator [Mycobacterium sp. CBMA293]|nr:AraC family transcriptional regulator [Mycolicibacterium sp. CBMA 360]MUL60545.1 AraC family transcriptional regulator [Mycolicibacterium sp. CBMA 335]MUL72360.1 AraC family transcriptional regulator [Mycolicibacterium sp. CBMA 311]MUL95239.1 AraC family transcriptional regulator [Mycolicibacterium sp. CBMA 230]MUM06942.1 AraC family transcriptional regulator [Mycolicibacterium sp. CBMA 213]MUM13880.1 AraC family transcriptional regulator [Mycolicibacterium sp. CBMA 293]MUM31151.1 AraC fam
MAPVWAVPRGTEGVRIMVQAAIAHGMTAAECLAGSGITEADLTDENSEIWAHQEFDVIRNLIAGLGDRPGVGIEVGLHSTLGRAGVIGFLILASATLRQGVELALPFLALSPTHLRFSVDTDHDYTYLAADDSELPTDVRAFIVERDLAGLVGAMHGAHLELSPIWVETTLDAEGAAKLAQVWHLPLADVRPGQRNNRLAAPRELLDQPLPLADENTARMLARQCRELLDRRLARVGVAGQVRSRLLYKAGELPSMQTVADELHVDPRTLRRRLASEGTSYRVLLDEVRRKLAIDLLREDVPVEEISRRLGYAETSNFTHAFKRWEGTAPSYFRRSG